MQMLKTILSPYPGNASIEIEGTTLGFTIDSYGEPATPLVVDLAEIVAKYSQDHGVIAIGQKGDQLLVVETTAISVGYRGSPYVGTYNLARRDSPLAVYRSLGGPSYPAILLLTPYRGCALDDCSLFFFDSSETASYPAFDRVPSYTYGRVDISVDGETLVAQTVGLPPSFLSGWLPISLTGPTGVGAGGSISLVVSAPPGTEVYLEALAGSLSRSRARSGDVVTLSAIDLPPGTRVRIKAGYKYWPGKTDVEIEVV